MSISRDSRHKRRATGGKRKPIRKKRKHELGRQPAQTKLGSKRIHLVRVRGGKLKNRALRLETGNFSWGTEAVSRRTRLLDVAYNASNNELVRTNTLVKSAVVQVDATPFRTWYLTHYGVDLGKKKETRSKDKEAEEAEKKVSKTVEKKRKARLVGHSLESSLADQFVTGRLFGVIASRPGQSGRADGYLLEGPELEFYLKKMEKKKKSK